MPRLIRSTPLFLALLIASCATPPKPAPRPAPPIPSPKPAPVAIDWRDLAETPGRWRYLMETGASTARFETNAGAAVFTLRCDKAARRVTLARADAPGAALKVTTSYGSRTLAAGLAASDPLLDQIAFSRGRFTIEAAGVPELVLPAWAEPGRVIEDCRG